MISQSKSPFLLGLKASRPNFLLLPMALISLAFAIFYHQTQVFSFTLYGLTLLGGIAAHIWVNLHNELTDTQNGLDALTTKTPFSGGTGALLHSPWAQKMVSKMLKTLLVFLVLLLAWFSFQTGWQILAISAFGGILMLSYSQWLVHRVWLCWMSAGMAFGPLMLIGAYWIAAQSLDWLVLVVSLIPFLWVNNLLLLNQIPDYFADQTVGRKNVVIQYGLKKACTLYSFSAILSLLVLWTFVLQQSSLTSSQAVLAGFLVALVWTLVIVWQLWQIQKVYRQMPLEIQQAFEQNQNEKAHIARGDYPSMEWLAAWQPVLGVNVAINILLPLSLSALLIFTA